MRTQIMQLIFGDRCRYAISDAYAKNLNFINEYIDDTGLFGPRRDVSLDAGPGPRRVGGGRTQNGR